MQALGPHFDVITGFTRLKNASTGTSEVAFMSVAAAACSYLKFSQSRFEQNLKIGTLIIV